MRATAGATPPSGALTWGLTPTSCRPPRLPTGVVDRDELVARLRDESAPVVSLRAPAGFGKTTAVRLWDAADPRPFAWLRLDHLDDDPTHLLRHVALALDAVDSLDDDVVRILAGAGRSAELDLLPALVEIVTRRDRFVLVVDEIESVTAEAALRCLDLLLSATPAGSQVVLVGRSVPVQLTARRRLGETLAEVEPAALKMSIEEAGALFRRAGVDIDDDSVEELVAATEGWVGGLRMAAMALSPSARRTVAVDLPRHPLVVDYLATEVLDRLPEQDLDFLLRAAVVDPLDAELLDEVLETHGSFDRLEALQQEHGFITGVEGSDHFHVHTMLRDVLLARLRAEAPEVETELLGRWTEALDARGDADRAIRAAVAAGATQRASEIVQRHTVELVVTGHVERLGQWLELLGDEATDRCAPAAVAGAWYALSIGDHHRLTEQIVRAERSQWSGPLPDGTPSIEVSLAVVRAMESRHGVGAAIESCDVARAGGGPAANPLWGLATLLRGSAHLMRGDRDLAQRDFLAARDVMQVAPVFECNILANLSYLELLAGDLRSADRYTCDALDLAERSCLDGFVLAMPVYAIGALVSARNARLEQAGRALTVARDLVTRVGEISARAAFHGWLLLAETTLVLGRRAEARTYAAEAQRARRRDPEVTALCQRLDELLDRLATGDGVCETDPLTPAELRVLRYLPTHYSLQEIADLVYISRNTAKSHAIAIYRKLGATTRSEAVASAREQGLLPPSAFS